MIGNSMLDTVGWPECVASKTYHVHSNDRTAQVSKCALFVAMMLQSEFLLVKKKELTVKYVV